jgi:hypothetical protein
MLLTTVKSGPIFPASEDTMTTETHSYHFICVYSVIDKIEYMVVKHTRDASLWAQVPAEHWANVSAVDLFTMETLGIALRMAGFQIDTKKNPLHAALGERKLYIVPLTEIIPIIPEDKTWH